MYRIASASGTTSVANENIINAIKQAVILDSISPFAMKKVNIFCDQATDIYFNTADDIIAQGKNKTFTKESYTGSGEFIVGTNIEDVLISKIVIAESGTSWQITFLY